MLDYKIKESGNWYGVIEQVDLKEGLEKIRQDSDILSERLMYNIGSTIEEQDGHQISVKAFSDENEISLPVNLGILLTNVRKCGNCCYNNTNNI